jgi:hypothetical protein
MEDKTLLSNKQTARLRAIAFDETKSVVRRLTACDRLAADCGEYITRQTKDFPHGPTTTRGRRSLITILRKLIKAEFEDSKRVSHALIQQRLDVVNGIVLSCGIWKPEATTPEQAGQSPVETELDIFLAKHGVYAEHKTGTMNSLEEK